MPKSLLTPIGERLLARETVPYSDFIPQALPPDTVHLSDFVSQLLGELMTEVHAVSREVHMIPSIRGSCVRRACWNLMTERGGRPVGKYYAISPWWMNFFSSAPPQQYTEVEEKVKRMLITGPKDLDPRLEYVLSEDKRLFTEFVLNRLPLIVERVRASKLSGIHIEHNHFNEGGDPFNPDDHRFSYAASIFHLYEGATERPILTLDFGTANIGRERIFTAHNTGELDVMMTQNGVFCQRLDRFARQRLADSFSNADSGGLYTAAYGLQGYDIITCGSRQLYIGAFYDPHNAPYFDPRILSVIRKLKLKYREFNEQRIPEIISNFIVGLMADPLYAFDSLRLADYFRQFSRLSFLADNPQKQLQLQKAIEKRMTPDYFIDGVWDPFLIIDAFNEIGAKTERTFSGLVKLFSK